MSLKKVGQVKADKGFKIWDLVVYGVIAVLVVALFIVVFTTRDTSPLSGVRISVKNEVVYEYDFGKGEISKNGEYAEVLSENSEKLILKITAGGGYNVVEIDKGGAVKVTEADCGKGDCVFTPQIKDNGGIIYCSPHGLKIVPYDFDIDGGNIIM
ncbi:MAG: NusG domain II-containing protein [Ruminococcus flavefaciens]|nr:NusG domain II-containing protein [Ruminococcus flavefaciens]